MISVKEIYWVAGFLEGEGYFGYQNSSTIRIVAAQTSTDPLLRLQNLFGGKIYSIKRKAGEAGQTVHKWYLNGPMAAGLCMTIYALMSSKRKEQIGTALRAWLARKVHSLLNPNCSSGHRLIEENTYISSYDGRKRRQCKECYKNKSRNYHHANQSRT